MEFVKPSKLSLSNNFLGWFLFLIKLLIDNLYISKNKEEISYNNQSYQSKDLWNTYISNLKENNIDIRFLNFIKSDTDNNKKDNFNRVEDLLIILKRNHFIIV